MNGKTTLILIGIAVVALIVIALVLLKMSNAKKKQKLLENLDKINQEKKAQIKEEITLPTSSTGQNLSKEEVYGKIEEPQNEEIYEEEYEEPKPRREEPYPRMPDRNFAPPPRQGVDRDLEFEQFLDEHGYSRKIFDKPLLEKIREMPPEIKAIVLGNIFDKFNDDK